jgi:biotin carboxyl carrier protein
MMIGAVQKHESGCFKIAPQVAVTCIVALGVIATLSIALSTWANIKMASLYGTKIMIQQAHWTIVLPACVVIGCTVGVKAFFTIYKTANGVPQKSAVISPETQEGVHMAPATPLMLAHDNITSPMTGNCFRILVKEGDLVQQGTSLCLIECMKMETIIRAEATGTITTIHVKHGLVESGAALFTLQKSVAE